MQAEKRKSQRRQGDRRRDTFGPAVEGIQSTEIIDALTRRDARIEIRCETAVKAEMEALAGRFGLTLTDYLLRLHALAAVKLQKET